MLSDAEFGERLELFFGGASDAVARVYTRLRLDAGVPEGELRGTLNGPHCLYATTLPATYRFVDRGPGGSLLAEAVVPEPSFWTPDLPHQYHVDVEWQRNGQIIASASRLFGLRPLGASGRKLLLNAKRWVFRGVRREAANSELADWHEGMASLVVRNPDDELCAEASRLGVLVAAEVDRADADDLRRLARFAAVGMVILPRGSQLPTPTAWSYLLAERFAPGEPLVVSPWADAVVCEVGQPEQLAAQIASCPLPVIAIRPAEGVRDVANARALVDRLQADLAGRGDFSGYVV